MASIRIKRSTTTGTVPGALQTGELAANTADARLWIGDASSTPVELGAAAPAPFPRLPKFAGANMFVAGQMNATAPTTMTATGGPVFLVPFCAPFDMTVQTIGVDVTNTGSANYLLGIYSADDDTFALNTLRASGLVTPDTTGAKTISGGGYVLQTGKFYLAAFQASASSGSIRAIASAAQSAWFGKVYGQAYFRSYATLTRPYDGTLPATIGYASMALQLPNTVPMLHLGW